MSNQLSFSLPKKETLDRDNYFVSQANQGAVSLIEDWINWPSQKLILVGLVNTLGKKVQKILCGVL